MKRMGLDGHGALIELDELEGEIEPSDDAQEDVAPVVADAAIAAEASPATAASPLPQQQPQNREVAPLFTGRHRTAAVVVAATVLSSLAGALSTAVWPLRDTQASVAAPIPIPAAVATTLASRATAAPHRREEEPPKTVAARRSTAEANPRPPSHVSRVAVGAPQPTATLLSDKSTRLPNIAAAVAPKVVRPNAVAQPRSTPTPQRGSVDEPPAAVAITVHPSTIKSGGLTTVCMTVAHARKLIVDGIGKLDPYMHTNCRMLSPTVTTTYSAVAIGKNGKGTRGSATVTVLPSEPPTSTAQSHE